MNSRNVEELDVWFTKVLSQTNGLKTLCLSSSDVPKLCERDGETEFSGYPKFRDSIEQANYYLGVKAKLVSTRGSKAKTWVWEANHGQVLSWGRISPNWDAKLGKFVNPAAKS